MRRLALPAILLLIAILAACASQVEFRTRGEMSVSCGVGQGF